MRTCCSSFVHWCAYPHYYTPCLLSSYLRCVVSQPIVRLSEIIKDDATAITSACREHNGRTGVGLGCDPGTVEGVHDEEGGDNQHHTIGNLSNTGTAKVYMMRKVVRISTTPLAICQTQSPSIHYTPSWRNKDSDSTFSHHTQAHRSYQVWLQKVKCVKRNVLDLHTDGEMDKANQMYTLLPTQTLLPKE